MLIIADAVTAQGIKTFFNVTSQDTRMEYSDIVYIYAAIKIYEKLMQIPGNSLKKTTTEASFHS